MSPLREWLSGMWHRLGAFLRGVRYIPQDATKAEPIASELLNFLTYLLLVVIACTLIVLAMRLLKRKRVPLTKAVVSPKSPDLAQAEIAANERPDEEWYKLAQEKIAVGDFRQAQRAMFLAILSCLASRRFITIERWKSNCDYEIELARKAKHLPALPQLYTQSRMGFERCWYGAGTLTAQDLETYGTIYERIRHAVA